jgi:hypothetical protein
MQDVLELRKRARQERRSGSKGIQVVKTMRVDCRYMEKKTKFRIAYA